MHRRALTEEQPPGISPEDGSSTGGCLQQPHTITPSPAGAEGTQTTAEIPDVDASEDRGPGDTPHSTSTWLPPIAGAPGRVSKTFAPPGVSLQSWRQGGHRGPCAGITCRTTSSLLALQGPGPSQNSHGSTCIATMQSKKRTQLRPGQPERRHCTRGQSGSMEGEQELRDELKPGLGTAQLQ